MAIRPLLFFSVVALAGAVALVYSAATSHSLRLQAVTVAIDVDPTAAPANTATSLGTIERCISIANSPGNQFTIDVIVDEIPSGLDFAGFGYRLHFDDTRFQITAQDYLFLLTSAPGSELLDVSESVPDTTSPHNVAPIDLGTPETGPVAGVLGRYTMEVRDAAPSGLANLSLSSPGLFQPPPAPGAFAEEIIVDQTLDGFIALGEPCPSELPPPAVAPSGSEPSSDQTPQAGETLDDQPAPGTEDTPGAAENEGTPSGAATPSVSPTADGDEPSTDPEALTGSESGDDGGGVSVWVIIVSVVGGIAAVLAIAGSLWWWRRRRAGGVV